jgi:protein tyrosine phosphatase (PTP) superfamily phosphohydrolase (DUF442 family)
MDAINQHQVFDWLWTSGQLSERDMDALPTLGIGMVVNLALPTSSNALRGEAERVTGHGMTYVQIPVVWERPEPAQFEQFASLLQSSRGLKVWVHCALNMRVSAFVYLYRRLVLGEDDSEAGFPMREVWTPDATWQAFIERVVADYKGPAGRRSAPSPTTTAASSRRP